MKIIIALNLEKTRSTVKRSLCQVNVGNFSFFFMTNIFSFKTAVIDGSFRLSPLVCLLAAGAVPVKGEATCGAMHP